MTVDTHALQRSLSAISIGVAKKLHQREHETDNVALVERTEQFQIPIAGAAAADIGTSRKNLDFSLIFANATGQRDSQLIRPQFKYGVVLEDVNEDEPMPVISAAVIEWDLTDRDGTKGAKIAISAHLPSTSDQSVSFEGYLHATFQGFAAPIIEDPNV